MTYPTPTSSRPASEVLAPARGTVGWDTCPGKGWDTLLVFSSIPQVSRGGTVSRDSVPRGGTGQGGARSAHPRVPPVPASHPQGLR